MAVRHPGGTATILTRGLLSPAGHAPHDSHDRHADHDAGFTAVHFTSPPTTSLNWLAMSATVDCLTGCAIGEVAGMVIGTALHWSNGATIALSIVLAFISGYGLTMLPLLSVGIAFAAATRLALAADTVSIAIMDVVDNAIMLVIPGAMDAHLSSPLFWGSLAVALIIAGVAAFPANRWLVARGRGHAAIHMHHG